MHFHPGPVSNRAVRPLAITIAVLMAISSAAFLSAPRVSAASPNLTVTSQTSAGVTLTGYWIDVTTSTGSSVQSGFTPGSFTLSPGSYLVSVGDYGGEYFSSWADGTATRTHPVTITSTSSVTLTAIYCQTQGGCGGGTSGSSIQVSSQYANGASLTGMYAVL